MKPNRDEYFEVALRIMSLPDGTLRVVSSNVPGLVLSSNDVDAVWKDLGPALQTILKRNHNWPPERS